MWVGHSAPTMEESWVIPKGPTLAGQSAKSKHSGASMAVTTSKFHLVVHAAAVQAWPNKKEISTYL